MENKGCQTGAHSELPNDQKPHIVAQHVGSDGDLHAAILHGNELNVGTETILEANEVSCPDSETRAFRLTHLRGRAVLTRP